jgi:hypothetical protein
VSQGSAQVPRADAPYLRKIAARPSALLPIQIGWPCANNVAATTPANDAMDPSDKSKSPMTITTVIVTATTPNMLIRALLHKLPHKESPYLSSIVAGGSAQLDTNEVHDPELGTVQISTKARGSHIIWFDPEMTWEAEPSGRRSVDAVCEITRSALVGARLRSTGCGDTNP